MLPSAWNQPVSRGVLDAAIELMLNDEPRRTLLGPERTSGAARRLDRSPIVLPGLGDLPEPTRNTSRQPRRRTMLRLTS